MKNYNYYLVSFLNYKMCKKKKKKLNLLNYSHGSVYV